MDVALAPAPLQKKASTNERVLFAIGAHERADFFPGLSTDFPGAESRWLPETGFRPGQWQSCLEDFRPTVLVSCWSTPAVPVAFAAAGSPLNYVCHLVGSTRALVPRVFLERGGLLTNWGGLAGETVAEHALLLALSALRKQPGWAPLINGPRVNPWRSGTMRLRTRTLFGRRVGIHGFGHVARSLVRLLQPFGVQISAYSPGVPDDIMRAAGVMPRRSLVELAGSSEIFFECEALTPLTHASIDREVLAALPDQAVFVNVGRGRLVDEPALLAEAQSGRIQIALDVVTHEPLGPDSPAAAISGAVLSPHIGGPTHDRFVECGRLALNNIALYLRAEALESQVTLELYDRST
jgi:phosphoglycerate dehydrogenase-like enzyme